MFDDPKYALKVKNVKLEFAFEEEPNLGVRKQMEDYTICEPDMYGEGTFAFFCVFDGHGGNSVAKYMKENYLKLLKNKLEAFRNAYTIPNILKMTIDNIEKQIQMIGGRDCGSTMCGILIGFKAKKIWTINIGDSKAMKIKLVGPQKFESQYITVEHKTTNLEEVKRVEKQGGSIMNGRLAGNLLITRSLGDFDFKKYGLISVPEITELDLNSGEYFIIASDGIWDVVDKEMIAKNGMEMVTGNLKLFCKKITAQAMQLGSTDNISMIIVKT